MNARNTQIGFNAKAPQAPSLAEWPPRDGAVQPEAADSDAGPRPDRPRNAATANAQLVEALARSAVFIEYQRTFGIVTGLPLALRGVECWQLAHSGHRHQNGFCALMSRTNRSCAACLQTQQRVCDGVNGVPCTLSCPFGIHETAVGVKIGREIVAYLQTGQVFFKPPTPRQTRRALNRIKELRLGLDPAAAARSYHATPVVGKTGYHAAVRLLQFFADQLGALANRIVLQQRGTEPGQITRARQFVEAHYQEPLSLAAVARQAGVSAFYFCKTFKKATGMKFTRYVSRVRVEKAKSLLLNPNYRIGEIAYEVGFQSLTHFNRVFKSVAGQSPTDYRRKLRVG